MNNGSTVTEAELPMAVWHNRYPARTIA